MKRPGTETWLTWRGLIGLVAAYAVALQLALSGFLLVSQTAANAVGAGSICTEHATTGGMSDPPADPHAICPCGPACTMAGCSPLLVGPLAVMAAVLWGVAAGPLQMVRPPEPPLPIVNAAAGPHSPRAPPGA